MSDFDVGIVERNGEKVLAFDSGTRAAQEGRDLASVIRGISTEDLRKWRKQFDRGVTPHELAIIDAELSRRSASATAPAGNAKSGGAEAYGDDRVAYFRALIERMDAPELAAMRHQYAGGKGPEETIICDELAKRRPGFSLPLVRSLDRAAQNGDDAAARLLGRGSGNAGNDAADRDESSAQARSLNAGVSYPGGKGGAGVYQRIIRHMPPHEFYLEPFLGKSAVMRNKKPAPGLSFGIDINPNVITWWERRLIKHPIANLQLQHGDALKLMPNLLAFCGQDLATTLIYADPEYLRETTTKARYPHPFHSRQKHTALLRMLGAYAERGAMVMLSGYHSMLYASMLRGWHLVEYAARLHRGERTECLWCSFQPPTAVIHDPRFAGGDCRERWNITKQARRMRAKFEKMDPLRRQRMYEVLGEVIAAASADSGGAARCEPSPQPSPGVPGEGEESTRRAVVRACDEAEKSRGRRTCGDGAASARRASGDEPTEVSDV